MQATDYAKIPAFKGLKSKLIQALVRNTQLSTVDLIECVYDINDIDQKSSRFKESRSTALRKLIQRTRQELKQSSCPYTIKNIRNGINLYCWDIEAY